MQHLEAYNRLRNAFLSKILFSDAELETILSKFTFKQLKKKQLLVEEGENARKLAFVVDGILRAFSIDTNGKEHILNFYFSDHWVTDMHSFLRNLPSELIIDALENSEILVIAPDHFQQLFIEVPKLERYWRINYENAYMNLQSRHINYLGKNAEELYKDLIKNKPQWIERLPLHQIAAYLGMTPENLSRLRAKKN